jgi:hypothetical protein
MYHYRLALLRLAIAAATALTFSSNAVAGPDDIVPLAPGETVLRLTSGLFADLGVSFQALGTTTITSSHPLTIRLPITGGIIDLETLQVSAEHVGTGLLVSNGLIDIELRDFRLDDFTGDLFPGFCYEAVPFVERQLTLCGNLADVFINDFGANPEDITNVVIGVATLEGDSGGQLPEPGTYGLLTVGLGAFLLFRKRRAN